MLTPNAGNTHISSDWAKNLEPGFRAVFYNTLDEVPSQYDQIFKVKTSKMATEKELGMGAFRQWTERINETDNVEYQKISQGLERTFTHKEFASGFAVGKRLVEDEQYNIINRMPEDLGRAGRIKVETDVFSVLNNAFTTVGYDGKALIAADHPLVDSTATASNLITGDLSDTTLKTALTLMRSTVDEAGKIAMMGADILLVAPANEWLALELIRSSQKPGSANNDINVLAGRLRVVVCDFLTDSDAWFVIDSKRSSLVFFWRTRPEFGRATDSDNFVAKYNGRMRYSYGYSDWRGICGSAGV